MRYLPGHTGFVEAVAFSPDSKQLASASRDGSLRLWDVQTGDTLWQFQEPAQPLGAVAFSPQGDYLCAGSHQGKVHLWCLDSGQPQLRYRWQDQGRVTAVSFSPDGKHLAWSSYNSLMVTNLHGLIAYYPFSETISKGICFTLCYSSDGKSLFIGRAAERVQVRSSATLTVRSRLHHGNLRGCWALACCPVGQAVALALGQGVQIWLPRQKRCTVRLHDHTSVVSGVAFSADGSRLLSGSWDGTAQLYQFEPLTAQIVRRIACLDWQVGKLYDVALSPDGMLAVAAGDHNERLVLWDLE